jgi:hypothetical protein
MSNLMLLRGYGTDERPAYEMMDGNVWPCPIMMLDANRWVADPQDLPSDAHRSIYLKRSDAASATNHVAARRASDATEYRDFQRLGELRIVDGLPDLTRVA